MLILPDNDVTGAVAVIQRILESETWAEYSSLIGCQFTTFEALNLLRNSPDRLVWQTCQDVNAILITANRAGDVDSLDQAIRQLSGPTCLPVITIGDPQRVLLDKSYAEAAALKFLEYMEVIESLLGSGRLFIP
ncbi:MAG TPA: hypothetical protein VGZ25_17240 [Gemmataceae bacterium]|jgi:hypothetical protein|nr:hypothetical protein [Gemmataceae bacterium]